MLLELLGHRAVLAAVRIVLPAVTNLDLVIPGQLVLAVREIAHPGKVVGLLSAGLADERAAAEIEDVILESPVLAGLVSKSREELRSDDFPRIALSLLDDVSAVVADGALAELVKDIVVADQVDRDRVHEVLPHALLR